MTVPVADVRATPASSPASGTHDPLQETQLLYGERVKVLNTDGPWAFIEAVEQAEYTHANAWQGYPGWVRQDALRHPPTSITPQAVVSTKWATLWADASADAALMQVPIGTKLLLTKTDGPLCALQLFDGRPAWIARRDVRFLHELRRLPVELRRQAVVRAAEQLLGDPYFWGGRSPHQASGTIPATEAGTPPSGGVADGSAETRSVRPTGVDCSGLVNLAYRTVGIDIPRDAHEQYVRARKIATPYPADLLFLSAPEDPRKIVHVMLYAGDGWLIEGPGTGLAVRRIDVATRLGFPVQDLIPGQRIGAQTLWIGSYLP